MSTPRGAHDADHPTEHGTKPTEERSWAVSAHKANAPVKTSAAAAFALVFGAIALMCVLTGVLAPLAVVFGIVGIVLGVIGRKKGAQELRTGKGVATAGLIMSIIALLLAVAAAVGAVTVLVNPGLLDPVQQWFTNLVNQVPTGS